MKKADLEKSASIETKRRAVEALTGEGDSVFNEISLYLERIADAMERIADTLDDCAFKAKSGSKYIRTMSIND